MDYTFNYRRSHDPLQPNIWFVYKEFQGSKQPELLLTRQSERDARESARSCQRYAIYASIASLSVTTPTDDIARFITEHLDKGWSPIQIVELYFAQSEFPTESLIPLKGEVDEFSKEVRKLERPYVSLSENAYAALAAGPSSYYKTAGGRVVTFAGNTTCHGANTQYALCPLNKEEAEKVLAAQ